MLIEIHARFQYACKEYSSIGVYKMHVQFCIILLSIFAIIVVKRDIYMFFKISISVYPRSL